MNVLFFLKPKSEVVYVYEDSSVRQVLEKMEHHRYSAVPMINRKGEYVGTITEGDLLWAIKNEYQMNLQQAEHTRIRSIPRRMNNIPVNIHANIEDLLHHAVNQNFVPVINEDGTFIGIVTRMSILQYCYENYFSPTQKTDA